MPKKYGNAPADLGRIDLRIPEVMYYLYLPVKMAGDYDDFHIPAALEPLRELLDRVGRDLSPQEYKDNYIYVTVKKMFVGGGVTPNRPGWHADGFGTNDLNYVWYDSVPTLFNTSEFAITEGDHVASLAEFDRQALPENDLVFPVCHLLKLDSSVVHRVADTPEEQVMRTFVKVSVSRDKYNLTDNSINHELDYNWEYFDRAMVRNSPAMAQRDSYLPPTPIDDHFV